MRKIALAAVIAATVALPVAALAAPPQVGGQAPGWFRMKLGSFEVTALNDGIFKLPGDKLLQKPVSSSSSQFFMKMPTTSWPCDFSSQALTAESTPPDRPTTTR